MPNDLRILMIDDDPEDHFITKDVFKELGVEVEITFLSEGSEVFEFLDSAQTLPNLILLDKNLPATDGLEILTQLKSDSLYKAIPVVVISGSAFPNEINAIYAAGANAFSIKPSSGKATTEKIKGFLDYWTNNCELPAVNKRGAQSL